MKKLLPVLLVVVVLGVGAVLLMNKKQVLPANPMMVNETPTEAMSPAGDAMEASPTATTGDAMMDKGKVKEFAVEGGMFYFKPAAITVKKGDTVKIVFTNKEGMHDWKIDEFNAHSQVIKAGETETVIFAADKVGTFEYYCSVGQHRANGMKGSLVVTE